MKFNLQSILEQAQKVQHDIELKKLEIAQKTVVAESGGGMVKVIMNGNFKINSLKISKEIIDPDDIEMLEDLVVAAFNLASNSMAQIADEELKKATSFLPNIPGLDLNL